ncbi:pilus assembly protein TadG-related protein [Cryptosporangium japonicum]|uniref:Putative Flp pilus-assembly TadG-like N-terminal domain-containing protein n=1 Tax=Cryptosporangium japonicum TaxID=80872 RepID=A0ABP3D944_9ACTN
MSDYKRPASRRENRDQGSLTPLVLLSTLLALLLIAGATTASSAFLAQRNLQSWCDAAALTAASELARIAVYGADPTPDQLAAELGTYLGGIQNEGAITRLSVQNDQITLVCTHTAVLPFGRLFGIPDGIERVVISSARVPWST